MATGRVSSPIQPCRRTVARIHRPESGTLEPIFQWCIRCRQRGSYTSCSIGSVGWRHTISGVALEELCPVLRKYDRYTSHWCDLFHLQVMTTGDNTPTIFYLADRCFMATKILSSCSSCVSSCIIWGVREPAIIISHQTSGMCLFCYRKLTIHSASFS